jgi:predicted nucleotidyltransferase
VASLAEASLSDQERRVIERLIELMAEELDLRAVWLYGSRARGEEPGPESDVDLYVITGGESWPDSKVVYRLLYRAADEYGANPAVFAPHVANPEFIRQRREIRSFFMQEVDRDKIVLYGEP